MPGSERPSAPRLERRSPPWSVSGRLDGREAIVATKGRTTLLRGEAAARVLRGEDPSAVTGAAPRPGLGPLWPDEPDVFADCPAPGVTAVWYGSGDLTRLLGQDGAPAYLLIAAEPAVAFECLESERTALGRCVTPVLIHGELVIAGPLFSADRWPCRRCWSRRLRGNLPTLDARIGRRHTVRPGGDAARLGRSLATVRTLWEARSPTEPRDRAMILDLERGAVTWERILPLAGCSCLHRSERADPDELVGRCFGTLQAVGAPAHPLAAAVSVVTARTRRTAMADIGGAAGGDGWTTRRRAIAEAIERLAGETVPAGTFTARLQDLADAPRPDELHPYTDEQYRSDGFAFRPLEPGAVLRWVPGTELASGRSRSVPLATVTFLDQSTGIAPPSSTGRAASRSWPSAGERALFEIAERDVVTRRWFEGEAVEADVSEWAPAEARLVRASGLDARLAICADEAVPVVVAAVVDPAGRGALGSAAGASVAGCAPHALEEALLMYAHRAARNTLLPVAGVWFAADGARPGGGWRSASTAELVRRYRPVAVVLTTPEAAAAGFAVAALWSPTAVDFPRPGAPLPLARWSPGAGPRQRIAACPDVFVGGGGPR